MASYKSQHPVEEINGEIDGAIHRRKTYRDPNGKVIGRSKKEIYKVEKPRDRKKHPAKGAELAAINRFSEGQRIASELIAAGKPGGNPTPEQLALYNDFNDRFIRQASGHADPEAPIDPMTKTRRHYFSLRTFIIGITTNRLKQQDNQ